MLHGLRALKRGPRLLKPQCVLVRYESTQPTIIDRHDRERVAPPNRGSYQVPYSGGHRQWTDEQLYNLKQKNVYDLRSPLEPKEQNSIKDLPSPRDLAEEERPENPYGSTRKLRSYFDTMQVQPPIVPERAETAPSLVTSVLMHDGTCKRFEMNRTESLNALDLKFVGEIRKLVRHWDDSPDIITYMGHTVTPSTMFCPGTDLRAILNAGRGSRYVREYYHGLYNLAQVIHTVKKPFFTVMDGPAFGSASVFMAAQFSTTTNNTIFACPDVLVGFFPDGGIVHKLAGLGEMGRYIALTGRRLNYADLHKLGMANFHIDGTAEVVGVQTGLGMLVDDSVYRIMSVMINMPIEKPKEGLFESPTIQSVEHLVKRVFKKKTIKLMMDELLKIRHEPEKQNGEGAQEWAIRTLKRMRKASPLSLCVTLEYLNLVSRERLTFDDVMTMDFRLSQRFAETDDYWEGIQAACERNRSATWSFKSVDDVPSELVHSFFRPFEDPRMELKSMASRPNDHVIDWVKYHRDFMLELTIPAPRPLIIEENFEVALGRLPPERDDLTPAEHRAVPTIRKLRDKVDMWRHITQWLNYNIRHTGEQGDVTEAMTTFQSTIMRECFTMLRTFVQSSNGVPVQILNAANDVIHSIQAIMLYASSSSTQVEWIIAAKDVLPIISDNLYMLRLLIFPLDIPANFETEAADLGHAAYDFGLIRDVDYVSH